MSPQNTYEFSEEQNNLFKLLGIRMRLFGTVAILIGLLMVGGALYLYKVIEQPGALLIGVTLNAAYFLVLGGPTIAVSKGFREIVETSKNDIDHLMDALGALQKVLLLNCIIVAALLVAQFFVPDFTPPA